MSKYRVIVGKNTIGNSDVRLDSINNNIPFDRDAVIKSFEEKLSQFTHEEVDVINQLTGIESTDELIHEEDPIRGLCRICDWYSPDKNLNNCGIASDILKMSNKCGTVVKVEECRLFKSS